MVTVFSEECVSQTTHSTTGTNKTPTAPDHNYDNPSVEEEKEDYLIRVRPISSLHHMIKFKSCDGCNCAVMHDSSNAPKNMDDLCGETVIYVITQEKRGSGVNLLRQKASSHGITMLPHRTPPTGQNKSRKALLVNLMVSFFIIVLADVSHSLHCVFCYMTRPVGQCLLYSDMEILLTTAVQHKALDLLGGVSSSHESWT